MKNKLQYIFHLLIVTLLSIQFTNIQTREAIKIQQFLTLATGSEQAQKTALIFIENNWDQEYQSSYSTMLLELMSFVQNRELYLQLNSLLIKKTSQNINFDQNA